MDFAFLRRLIAFSSQKSAKNKLLFTFHEFWVVQKANDKYYCRSIKFGFQYFCWLFNGPSFFSVFFSFFFIKSGSDKKNDWKSPVPHVRRIWVTVSIRHESASKLNIMPRQRQNGSVPFITLNASFLQFVFCSSSRFHRSLLLKSQRFCWDVLSVKPFYRFDGEKKRKKLLMPQIRVLAWQYAEMHSKQNHEYRVFSESFFSLVEGARDLVDSNACLPIVTNII